MDDLREIGEKFRSIPADTYFRSAKTPAETYQEALDRYGVQLRKSKDQGDRILQATPWEQRSSEDYIPHRAKIGDVRGFLMENQGVLGDSDLQNIYSLMKERDPVYSIDSFDSEPGKGGASRTYPAMYDLLSGVGGIPNLSGPLTTSNLRRKGMNSADAILRNPQLVSRILPNSQQMGPLNLSPLDYQNLDPYSQLGAHLMSSAVPMTEAIQGLNNLGPIGGGDRRLYQALDLLGTQSSAKEYKDFLKDYGYLVGPRTGAGSKGLRKLSLIDSILKGEFEGVPLEVKRGVGYRSGGLMKVHKCSCGE